jgi:hypothetical protein
MNQDLGDAIADAVNDNADIVDGLVASSGGSGVLKAVTATLTASQLSTTLSVPILVVPAPGAGRILVPIMAIYELVIGSASFSDAGQQCDLAYGASGAGPHLSMGPDVSDTAGFFGSTVPVMRQVGNLTGQTGFVMPVSVAVNQPIYFANWGGSDADLSGGGTSTLKVTVLHYLFEL